MWEIASPASQLAKQLIQSRLNGQHHGTVGLHERRPGPRHQVFRAAGQCSGEPLFGGLLLLNNRTNKGTPNDN